MSEGEGANGLQETIRKMLWENWDPIGVNQFPEAIDEYDGYVFEVAQLVEKNAPKEEIFNHLWALETGHIGLQGDRENTLRFSEELASLSARYHSGGWHP